MNQMGVEFALRRTYTKTAVELKTKNAVEWPFKATKYAGNTQRMAHISWFFG